MKKLIYLIMLVLILGLVLSGCLLSNVGQVPATEQSGITYLTKTIDSPLVLAARWDFNTITAGTVADLSGNPNTGNVFGATLVDSGQTGYGNALNFNGVYDRVEVAHSSSLNITGTGITLEAWIKAAEFPTTGRDITINKTGAYALQVSDGGKVRVYLCDASNYVQTDNVELSTGIWHHIAGTYDGSNVRIYVDGDLKKTVAKTGNQATSTNPLVIGKRDPGITNTDGALEGLIDEVRIWSSALNDDQLDDMLPPAITITTPSATTYLLNEEVYADWSVSDGTGTGVATESAVPSELKIDTSTVGSHTFTVTATDYAINEASQAVTYYVHEPFGGFLPPVETGRAFKLGSTIPVKFQLRDAEDNFITDAVAMISLQKLVSGLPEGEVFEDSSGAANTGNLFRYDPTSNQYIFNLSTKGATFGTWRITITLDYGATYFVDIGLK